MRPGVIGIRDLEIFCVIGILQEERHRVQAVRVDVEVACDISRSVASDDAADTLDYATLAAEVTAFLQEKQFGLLERAAHELCDDILRRHPIVRTVRVEMRKPGAIAGPAVPYVRLERERFALDQER